jgi:hypothetical protein
MLGLGAGQFADRVAEWITDDAFLLAAVRGAAWLFDLGELRGPWILVLRDHEDEARQRLAEHLVELGQAGDVAEAMTVLSDVAVDHAGVIW